jgi:hypothetical protein
MAEGETKKRSSLQLILVVIALLAGLGIAIWFTRPQAENPANAPPPEMGPDTAQAPPADAAEPATAATQLAETATAAPSADPIVSAAAAGPPVVTFKDETLSFSAALPDGPVNDPVLTFLRRDAQNYLAEIKINARADYDRLKKAGEKPSPWEVRVRWAYTARADDIVSLAGESSEYNGGAHPMLFFDTHIARTSGEKLNMGQMLVADRSPSPAMTIAICEALKSAKAQRIKSPTIFDEPIVCVGPNANAKIEAAKIALAPSNQPERFGGLYAYYEPYAVGAYSEGPYRLTVQQAVFAEDLRPEFRKLFAGEAPVL